MSANYYFGGTYRQYVERIDRDRETSFISEFSEPEWMAERASQLRHPNGSPMFLADGGMLDEDGRVMETASADWAFSGTYQDYVAACDERMKDDPKYRHRFDEESWTKLADRARRLREDIAVIDAASAPRGP